jgi:ELWxxDGT repeat protein
MGRCLGALVPIELFVADDGVHGRELWRTDGTAAGTQLVADLDPAPAGSNPENYSSSPANFFVNDDVLYFIAATASGMELYRTNGTADGTVAVTTPTDGGFPSALTPVGDKLFWIGDTSGGSGLFVLDSSTGAPTFVTALAQPSDFMALGDQLLFVNSDAANGEELWVSDGTAAGTHILADLNPGPSGSYPGSLMLFQGEAYFSAEVGGVYGLWKTDGTASGTLEVTGDDAEPVAVAGGELFFETQVGSVPELWATDGSAAGTVQLTSSDELALYGASAPQAVGGKLYFSANETGSDVIGLYVSDGTAAGTSLVADIQVESAIVQAANGIVFTGEAQGVSNGFYISNGSSGATLIESGVAIVGEAVVGGKVFLEVDPASGDTTQLWVSDGTAAGTTLLKTFQDEYGGAITAFGDDVLLSASTPAANGFTTDQYDNELWISDGTVAGTHEVLNINPPIAGSLYIDQQFVSDGVFTPIAVVLGSELVFSATIDGQGHYLVGSDGTSATTELIGTPATGQASSTIEDFTVVGADAYFLAEDASDAFQLWVTNGAAGSAVQLTGPTVGFQPGAGAEYPTAFDGELYFVENSVADGYGLFATDGTVAGAQFITDVAPLAQPVALSGELIFYGGGGASDPVGIYATDGAVGDAQLLAPIVYPLTPSVVASGGQAFFTFEDASRAEELWVTNGTPSGTTLLATIASSASGVSAPSLTAFDGGVVFTANDDVHGGQVWFSNGTAAGTYELVINPTTDVSASLDLSPGGSGASLPMVGFDGKVYLVANDGFHGAQLWSTDGTAAGTQMVDPSGDVGEASFLTPFSGGLFFESGSGNPWITDGTAAGTTELSTTIDEIGAVSVVGDEVYFQAGYEPTPGVFEEGLFVTDGTAAGTSAIATDGVTGIASFGDVVLLDAEGDASQAAGLYAYDTATGATIALNAVGSLLTYNSATLAGTALGDGLFVFAGSSVTDGGEPWVTNGTAAGTFLLKDIVSGSGGSDPDDFVAADGKVFFATTSGTIALWSTDGTAAGTVLATNLGGDATAISNLLVVGADLYFDIANYDSTLQLWDYDTSTSVATEVSKLGESEGVPTAAPVAAGGVLYFEAPDSSGALELWRANGAGAPTQLTSSATVSEPMSFQAAGAKLFFVGATTSGEALFVTDGTAGSTLMLTTLSSGQAGYGEYAVVGGNLYFQNSDAVNGSELWVSDGTVAGTHRVSDTETPNSANASEFTVADGQVFFSATDGVHGQELWTFNGTSGGDHMVADLASGAASSTPVDLTAVGDRLLFVADPGSGDVLWATDGTTAGTVALTSAENGGDPSAMTVVGDELFFAGSDSVHGAGLFVTDGTTSGTAFLGAFSNIESLMAVGDELYFDAAATAGSGDEIWKSNGTAAGTIVVTDTTEDAGSNPSNFATLPPPLLSDFNGDGVSDLLIENTEGAVVVGEVAAGAAGFAAVAALGPEWTFHGDGDFLGDGKEDFLIENTAGVVAVGEVSGASTAYTAVASLGPEWSFQGVGDFLGDGKSDLLIENTAGAVVVGEVTGGVATYTAVASLGPEWRFVGAGDYLGDGKSDFLIENAAGAVVVSEVTGSAAVYTPVASLGPEWKFVGTGDFLGDGRDDFLIENSSGSVVIGEVVNGAASYTAVTSLGAEWSFVGAGDYLGEGHDQFLIENSAGAVVVGDWSGGAIHFTPVATLGPEWAFH